MKKNNNTSYKMSYESDNKMRDSKNIQDKKKDDAEISLIPHKIVNKNS